MKTNKKNKKFSIGNELFRKFKLITESQKGNYMLIYKSYLRTVLANLNKVFKTMCLTLFYYYF
jgi:hypothetical protein